MFNLSRDRTALIGIVALFVGGVAWQWSGAERYCGGRHTRWQTGKCLCVTSKAGPQ